MAVKLGISIPDERAEWLDSWKTRTMEPNPVSTAVRALEKVLAAELQRVPLETAEAILIAHAVGQPLLNMSIGSGMLAAQVADFAAGLDAAGLDDLGVPLDAVDRLTARLMACGPTADLALRDAFSRWWTADGAEADAEGFAAFGLRVGSGITPLRVRPPAS